MNNFDKYGFTSEDLQQAGISMSRSEELESLKFNEETDLTPEEESAFLSSQEEVQEVGASQEEIANAAKESLDFLAGLCMPAVFRFFFPAVFISLWQWLTSFAHKVRDFSQICLGLPRGFGKSTVMKLFILYCILFTKKKFILVIAATATLAENILADVTDMLEEPNVKAVFGDWKLGVEKDTQSLKKFGFRGRNIILAGIGCNGSLRGLNLKNERPDVMLFDDVQTRECADSEIESSKLEQWMIGTAMKAKSPIGCLYIFVGNMYPTKYSILRKLKNNPKWIKFIAGGILADGTSLWEELQPVNQLLAEFENDLSMGHPEIFYAEVLNDENASSNNLIDLNKLPAYPYPEDAIPFGNFIIIDPSNDKANSDAVSTGYFEIYDNKPVLVEHIEGRLSPGDTITSALEIALRRNCRLVVIEANAYQYSLAYWFNFICTQRGIIGIDPVPIYSGSLSKNSRILTWFKAYLAGECYIQEGPKAAVHSQIMSFNPLKKNNVDGLLDLMTYSLRVLTEFSDYIYSLNIIEEQETQNQPVVLDNSCI